MNNNLKWKDNFKDFFFEKDSASRKAVAEAADSFEKMVTKDDDSGHDDSGNEKEGKSEERKEESVNNHDETDLSSDDSKSLLSDSSGGTMRGRLMRMFNKSPPTGEEGERGAGNDDDKTAGTNVKTNQVQMVDKSVSTEDKDDVTDNKEDQNNPDDSEAANNVIGSGVEEKKRFRFQLFSK